MVQKKSKYSCRNSECDPREEEDIEIAIKFPTCTGQVGTRPVSSARVSPSALFEYIHYLLKFKIK